MRSTLILLFFLSLIPLVSGQKPEIEKDLLDEAASNAQSAAEGLARTHRYLHGWLAHADRDSGLLPRRLPEKPGYRKIGGGGEDFWNAQDCAADNYPFLVLSSFFTDSSLFNSRMKAILETEIRLTTRKWGLPDDYSFSSDGFRHDQPDRERMIFGASEYVKDGLLPVTEWLGPSPWSERMLELLDAVWAQAAIETAAGTLPSLNVEVNGEMLQTLSRVYWMTGNSKYLEWAERLGDFYLLGENHPTRDSAAFRLRDHGCEILSGLCELYATVAHVDPERRSRYRQPLYDLLDRVLEVGRNPDGLFYNSVNPQTGEVLNEGISDSWGYNFNGFYSVYLLDGTTRYRQAALKALSALEKYRDFNWESGSADGFADSIEGALNLFNREGDSAATARWIDEEIRHMWSRQQEDGVIEGWYGDGNFARTTLMYVLWKTRGTWLRPWRPDLRLGAADRGDQLLVTVESDETWKGRLFFDRPRHRVYLHLPLDWPRINQFPEWFTVEEEALYQISDRESGETMTHSGAALISGLAIELEAGRPKILSVSRLE